MDSSSFSQKGLLLHTPLPTFPAVLMILYLMSIHLFFIRPFATGVFKSDDKLVGYMTVELSNLIHNFLRNIKENHVSAIVAGQRKGEVGLVVRGKYSAFTKYLKTATIQQRKEKQVLAF